MLLRAVCSLLVLTSITGESPWEGEVRQNRVFELSRRNHTSSIQDNHSSDNFVSDRPADLLRTWLRQDEARRGEGNVNYISSCYWAVGSSNPGWRGLNLTLCSHLLLIGGVSIRGGQLYIYNATRQACSGLRQRVNQLPSGQRRPQLLLSITTSSANFSYAASTNVTRRAFSVQAVKLLHDLQADGLDFDWEFPVWSTGDAREKQTFPLLLQEIRSAMLTLQAAIRPNSLPPYPDVPRPHLLSAAVGAPKRILDVGYDVPALGRWVDFINLMSYDYHFYQKDNPLEWVTGFNSPLYKKTEEISYLATENTAWSSEEWIKRGLTPSKLLVGIPTYGHTYTLEFSWFHSIWAPVKGVGDYGGWCNFQEVCDKLQSKKMKSEFDTESRVPYAYTVSTRRQGYAETIVGEKGNSASYWWSYDDVRSVREKVDYVKAKGYGGVMVFDYNSDDWQDKCGMGPVPLITAIHDRLESETRLH